MIVDDDIVLQKLLEKKLNPICSQVVGCQTLSDMQAAIAKQTFDLILLDLFLGDEYGLDAVEAILAQCPGTKVIIFTANGSIDAAVKAVKMGACNFFVKNGSYDAIFDLVASYLPTPSECSSKEPLVPAPGIIGKSPKFIQALNRAKRLSEVDSTVLILGDSGTGKEVFSRAIHEFSERGKNPFQAINCAAIPEHLLESELFGYKKGAFTDAKQDKKGLFEACQGGTVLLDEVGDMPPLLQTKLLRFLQEHEIQPVGANKPIKVDIRVLAATNCCLKSKIKEGLFRADLFYRLSVFVFSLPPLRERSEDIPLLVQFFLDKLNRRYGKNIKIPKPAVLARLAAYSWPGNIRELQNVVERAFILAEDGYLEEFLLEEHDKPAANSLNSPLLESKTLMPMFQAKEQFERAYMERLLEVSKGSITKAAHISGQYRANIYRILQKYNMSTAPSQSTRQQDLSFAGEEN